MPQTIILMGVSGVGKSTLGKMLAEKLKLAFFDADDFHSEANISKMNTGLPLNDDDRKLWLENLAENIKKWSDGAVLACSALKEKYRQTLIQHAEKPVKWVYLYEDYEMIKSRMEQRKDHYFKPELLKSQFDTLEPPAYGIHIKVNKSPEENLKKIMNELERPHIGLIGLGVMGKSLALNMASKGIPVSVYNRDFKDVEVDIAKNFAAEHEETYIFPWFNDLQKFVASLPKPRNIMIMVKAGAAVDAVINELLPVLDAGDLIIDGGNSHFKDTAKRIKMLGEKDIYFLGTGISGGEEGALKGPSIMPGGSKVAYERAGEVLEKIAARDPWGDACCTYIGPEGSGHFVKMLHNGIEYGEMQLIAEFYHLLRFFCGMDTSAIADLFAEWNTELRSYLLEISIDILRQKEENDYLLDKILDVAGQKGTGGWSTEAALELGVPLDTITAAVLARNLSAFKADRIKASKKYHFKTVGENVPSREELFRVYRSVMIINHSIGFELLRAASKEYNWDLNLSEIARIWTGGCIIKSGFMEELVNIFKDHHSHLLLQDKISDELKNINFAKVLSFALENACPMPLTSAAATYLFGFSSQQSSANMIQAQRDYFGAHTFERIDKNRGEFFHFNWKKPD
ncbi:phosphogluconate dehydrogenase (NADP(+)-dependent, decarboxylating) [Christiangramia fulva]|uniref:6-phosphogluconate dehydrogenase, decarboxylating n=1 Tax=Christiangramia fulva TaxID=2126553 RepID=A0A2R3Z7X7_9FLAO|nr:decarboxylating NADP(+)-dependent phosphogluconate dehydrogenase [Christiangramia fulva]AVR46332.1 phosphogluconate dehydrogenase (NADP(+)-dependent, decarboxylating) [Christiangramia fulva]